MNSARAFLCSGCAKALSRCSVGGKFPYLAWMSQRTRLNAGSTLVWLFIIPDQVKVRPNWLNGTCNLKKVVKFRIPEWFTKMDVCSSATSSTRVCRESGLLQDRRLCNERVCSWPSYRGYVLCSSATLYSFGNLWRRKKVQRNAWSSVFTHGDLLLDFCELTVAAYYIFALYPPSRHPRSGGSTTSSKEFYGYNRLRLIHQIWGRQFDGNRRRYSKRLYSSTMLHDSLRLWCCANKLVRSASSSSPQMRFPSSAFRFAVCAPEIEAAIWKSLVCL